MNRICAQATSERVLAVWRCNPVGARALDVARRLALRARLAENQQTCVRTSERARMCPTRTPEPHELGEFPMSCYACHLHADA